MKTFDMAWGSRTAWLAITALIFGCGEAGSERALPCGEGTERRGGACVPKSADVACGEGTTLVEGECVGETSGPERCGAGTEWVDGKCVSRAAEVECGEGTELRDGACVPSSDPLECGEGTALVDGECVPDPSRPERCGEGTELVGGACVVECAEDQERIDGICVLACDTEGAPFGGGDGSSSAPYRICAAWHIAAIDDHLDKDFILTRNLDLAGVVAFEPLGGSGDEEGFRGRFDGAGMELRNLEIHRPAEDHVGLFRRIESSGEVLDLGLVDFTVTGKNHVGALVGSLRGSIASSHVGGTVTGGSVVGGMAGMGMIGDIKGSYATGTVSGVNMIGGLVGFSPYAMPEASYYLDRDGRSTDGTPLSSNEFGDMDSFAHAWDFEGVWQMQDFPEPDFRRPVLRENPEAP